MFLRIDDSKKRDKIVEDFLKTRKNIKQNFEQDKLSNIGFREETQKLFKPITESITEQKTSILDKIEDQNVILKKLPTMTSGLSELIKDYLSDPNDRSNAGYSIRYDATNKQYTIGNSVINFDYNVMEIAGKRYKATRGLMELLTKKDPDTDQIIEEEYGDYKTILWDTKALYHNFDPSTNRVYSDRSEKWKIIRNELFPNLFKKTGGKLSDKNVIFLPSDPISLIDQLQLSIASYTAGNNGEYNKIYSILDQLLKQKIITKNNYLKIMKNNFIEKKYLE
jgi:hypothetical protein